MKRIKVDSLTSSVYLQVKPLSVNKVWQGRRFKSKDYKEYERVLLENLPDMKIPPAPYFIFYTFGFSNYKMSDVDNPVKPLQDILVKRYGIRDQDIKCSAQMKEKTEKGLEFFRVNIYNADSLAVLKTLNNFVLSV